MIEIGENWLGSQPSCLETKKHHRPKPVVLSELSVGAGQSNDPEGIVLNVGSFLPHGIGRTDEE
ncbi:hypothetical protein NKJ46_02730 [Mesorhizobium sp. M0166]|uniref:hypothetical protein n=1 Tax=Mesorhizobium sp. M0166 TaxID=2956902 RepID=UPI00333B2580